MPERVSIQWNRAARGSRPANPCFKLSPEILVELPPAGVREAEAFAARTPIGSCRLSGSGLQ